MNTEQPGTNTVNINEAAQNIIRLTGQSGAFGSGLLFNQHVIHNDADPMEEARSWIKKSLRERVGRQDSLPALALVFGLGLGYHLKALREIYPDIRLLVFEPTHELKIIFERHSVMDTADGEAPLIFDDWFEYDDLVNREVVYGRETGVLVVAPDGYQNLCPEAFEAFNACARQVVMRRAVIEHTRENTDVAFLHNLAKNSGRLMELPDLMVLKGRLPARPAFAVGAGPSLDESLPLLRDINGRGMIFAASSALKPLLAGGVRPDVVVVLESSDTSEYLQLSQAEKEFLGPNCLLALASGCHPAHYKADGFLKGIFHLTGGEAQIFSQGLFLPQGGNAGSAAFALAFIWGLGPLVLVAQDQAYTGGRIHAAGTPGGVTENDPGDITVNGIGRTAARTHSGLLASLSWFAEAAKTISQQDNPPLLYNASAAGASIPGFSEVPLSAVLASLPPAAAPLNLAGAIPKLPMPDKKEVKKDIKQLAGVVTTLRRLAAMDYRKAFEETKQVGKVSKFLGQILAEAAVANSRNELIAALDKADGLLSLMMSAMTPRH